MTGVLVDTSVWVDHFRSRNENLVSLLTLGSALSHPLIVAELAQRFDVAFQPALQ